MPPDPWATFVYEKPAPVYRLRLAIEQLSMTALSFTGYLIWNPPPAVEGVPTTSIWEKLTFAPNSWYLDADSISTNFGGHVAAGTFYYMFARANRVSVPEAFLWTLGTSTLWELIEFKEPVSINDMIVTPVSGLAIGEAFTQLSGWFDRNGSSKLSKALAVIFNPMKKFHDWMDKAEPRRDPAYSGWHEFRAGASGQVLWQDGHTYPGIAVEFATRLFRAPGYGEAGGTGFGFADGNVSAIGLTATIAGGQTVDFLFDTETALVGHYSRDLRTDGEGLSGWDLFVGGTAGYEFGSHAWDLAGGDPRTRSRSFAFPASTGASVCLRATCGWIARWTWPSTSGGSSRSEIRAPRCWPPARSSLPCIRSRGTTSPSASTWRRRSSFDSDLLRWAPPFAPTGSGE